MKIATYHNHDGGSFLHAGALALPTMSLTADRGRSRRRHAIRKICTAISCEKPSCQRTTPCAQV